MSQKWVIFSTHTAWLCSAGGRHCDHGPSVSVEEWALGVATTWPNFLKRRASEVRYGALLCSVV
jgi:hypothetical protein